MVSRDHAPSNGTVASGHTPGPWSVAEPDANGQPIVRAEHIEIATCWHHCVESIEREAHTNARLIAAAPELLEALKELHEKTVVGTDAERHAALHQAWAAISKATAQ